MKEELQQALDLVAKHGSVRAASKASGIAKSTLQGRYNKAKQAQNKPEITNVLQRKKYEFTGKTKDYFGITLRQIRALVTISGVVTTGDCGGWVEGENNLAQVSGNAWVYGDAQVSGNAQVSGDAWVSGNARVSGNAQVSGNAWVYGDAQVYGNARVSGNAQVSGDAWVSGNARVSGNAQVSGNAWVYGDAQVYGDAWVYGDAALFWASKVGTENGTLTVFNSKDGTLTVTRGCFIGPCDDFIAKSKRVHDEKTHREYCLLIEVAKSRIECKAEEVKEAA